MTADISGTTGDEDAPATPASGDAEPVEAEATEGSWELIKAGATKPDEAVVAQGLEASKPFLTQLKALDVKGVLRIRQATAAGAAAKEVRIDVE